MTYEDKANTVNQSTCIEQGIESIGPYRVLSIELFVKAIIIIKSHIGVKTSKFCATCILRNVIMDATKYVNHCMEL